MDTVLTLVGVWPVETVLHSSGSEVCGHSVTHIVGVRPVDIVLHNSGSEACGHGVTE